EISKTDEYRKIRQIDLITIRKLVLELEKLNWIMRNVWNDMKNYLKNLND
ncbi:hypothetical protein WUBG_05705, partial [Wuchereria bancrofti]